MSSRSHSTPKALNGFTMKNKLRRQETFVKNKKARDSAKRDERFRRKREEDKNPSLREERRSRNVPVTLDQKRVWDDVGGDEEDALGLAVDVNRIKRQKTEDAPVIATPDSPNDEESQASEEDEIDSMLGSDSESDSFTQKRSTPTNPPPRSISPSSTATNLDISPEFLKQKFPNLFNPPTEPKILITTSINSTLHKEAEILTTLFPNSNYIRRTAHQHGHKYSIKEIAKFASNRDFTSLVVLMEDKRRPAGLDIVHLPSGPHLHFSVSNWIEGKKLPGHGNPDGWVPELILTGFRTPLGITTAHSFKSLFPTPEIRGRTVVTLHCQRDYIFVRQHRYRFRDKKDSEKSVVGSDGKVVKGVEDIRAGLQELGPRFTLKLRRIDRGIQFASGQEWTWKGKDEKVRTRFAL